MTPRVRALLLNIVLIPVAIGSALLLTGGAGPGPVWAHPWPKAARDFDLARSSDVLHLADLKAIGLGLAAGFDTSVPRANEGGQMDDRADGRDLAAGIRLAVDAYEMRQREAAAVAWDAYLEELAARRLAAARLAWEERFRDLAIRLGEEQDRLLKAYAAEVRWEYFPRVSSVQMQIALSNEPSARARLEEQLAVLTAEIEAKIARRREDLARQCALELGKLQNQAEEALAGISVRLQEEMRVSSAAFKAIQNPTAPGSLPGSKLGDTMPVGY